MKKNTYLIFNYAVLVATTTVQQNIHTSATNNIQKTPIVYPIIDPKIQNFFHAAQEAAAFNELLLFFSSKDPVFSGSLQVAAKIRTHHEKE